MKITKVYATATSKRRAEPIRDALQTLDTRGECLITIETDEGVRGSSSTYFGRVDKAPALLALLVNEIIGPAIIGEDPFLVRGIRDKLWKLNDYHGVQGPVLFAIAGIDIALWDIMGRALEQPVWRLLGAQRTMVPAYSMSGWLTLAEDVARIEAVRSVIGDQKLLMVDANQVFTVNEALRRGRVYEEMGCYWFEEPLRADDVDGLALLAHDLTIPIASGENNYGKRQFRELFTRRAVDIVQPDLRRAGGVTECLEIGLMADAFNIPYASHGGGIHLHVLAALPNTLFMESGLLPDGSSIKLVDGCYPLPEEPGFGHAH